MGKLSPMADRRIARTECDRRYEELFDLIDSVLDDHDLPATEVAQSAAQSLGLPWQYTPSIGHLDVCLDAFRPRRYVRWLRWPRRQFARLGKSYVCVTDDYAEPDSFYVRNGKRMRPMTHTYVWWSV